MNCRGSFIALLLCGLGWSSVAQATPSAELEVVGQISVHAEVEPTAEGQQIVRGRLSDEVGKPVGGTLSIKNGSGGRISAQACPWQEPDNVPTLRKQLEAPGTIPVAPDGEFCFIVDEQKGLAIEATSEHFMDAVHDLDLGLERALTRPRFVQSPSTIDLHGNESYVVQLLARSERRPPEGARLSLSLECQKTYELGQSALSESRMQRFELAIPEGVKPGNCRLSATVSAPGQKSLQATRAVLIRDRVSLQIVGQSESSKLYEVDVRVTGTKRNGRGAFIEEGLVEAREGGAFVALSPVKKGRAVLEFERSPDDRAIELSYVPASSAYLPSDPISHVVPSRAVGFQWASIHTLALIVFGFWLGYAWLRPQRDSEERNQLSPPKRSFVQESGKKTGPIGGQVKDAHTGEPLGDIELTLQAVGADKSRELEKTRTDAAGKFTFGTALESHPLLRIEANGPDHMSLTATIRSTSVTVHLTERRRAVVQALVGWARRAGRPWDQKPTVTPGALETLARERGESEKAEWAERVGAAAYAPAPPSEAAVEALRNPGKSEGVPGASSTDPA